MSKGVKNDAGKPDLSLLPKVALDLMAEAFMVGERKYGRYNYLKGMEASRIIAALLRHATAWNEGEERDPIDGQHHLGSIMACAAILANTQRLGTLIDDRYKPQVPQVETRLATLNTYLESVEAEKQEDVKYPNVSFGRSKL